MEYHVPVMLSESINGLNLETGGVYVDVTFGGGGHSREIYQRLIRGKLIAFDQDPDSAANAKGFESDAQRSFVFVPANFRYLRRYLKFHKVEKVEGILADLGVSSHQFDVADRGFSTRFEGKLDMRMDQKSQKSAETVINDYSEKELVHIFSLYGEIKNAKTLAGAIVQERNKEPITTTTQLTGIAERVGPKARMAKYHAQLFQAIRIEVNEEMEALKDFLSQTVEVLKPGGRLVVISYHSLEDRLVKNFINTGNFSGRQEKDFYGNLIRPLEPVNRKPIVSETEELKKNTRARSAKLRIAENRKTE